MKLNTNELSALTRLFSSAVFQELAKKGHSARFTRLLGQTPVLARCESGATVGDAFDLAFSFLKLSGFRDEYVYRAALVRKVLLGRHSLRTASMLHEFRTGSSKADIVILNGTATVYEIKSERDSLARLLNQVENYQKVFASVNVIASENHLEKIRQIVPKDTGLLCLTKRFQISSIRDAAHCPERISPLAVFESLRSDEAATILTSLGINVPTVPNTLRHDAMRQLFADLEPVALHQEMVSTLKKTRSQAPLRVLIDQLPASLHTAALSVPVRNSDHGRLVNAVATPLRSAMTWA